MATESAEAVRYAGNGQSSGCLRACTRVVPCHVLPLGHRCSRAISVMCFTLSDAWNSRHAVTPAQAACYGQHARVTGGGSAVWPISCTHPCKAAIATGDVMPGGCLGVAVLSFSIFSMGCPLRTFWLLDQQPHGRFC